ncbi:MAG: chemotaxis protein CheA [Thermodesulfobacteriota bacterium]
MAETITISLQASELDLLREFLLEGQDLLAQVEDEILRLEDGDAGQDALVQGIFRSVHTIKGTSGFFGLAAAERLGHRLEALLDLVRGHRVQVTPDVADCLLGGVDRLKKLLAEAASAASQAREEGGNAVLAMTDLAVQDVLDWLEGEIDKGKAAAPAAPAAVVAAPAVAASGEPFPELPAELLAEFLAEANGHLEAMEGLLKAAQAGSMADDGPDAIFRYLHTVKGNSGMVLAHFDRESDRERHVLAGARDLAHAAEHLVQQRRATASRLSPSEVEILFQVRDTLVQLLERLAAGDAIGFPVRELVEHCRAAAEGRAPAGSSATGSPLGRLLTRLEHDLAGMLTVTDREQALARIRETLQDIAGVAMSTGDRDLKKKIGEALTVAEFLCQDSSEESMRLCLPDLVAFSQEVRQAVPRLAAVTVAPAPALAPAQGRPAATPEAATAGEREQAAVIRVPSERLDQLMNLVGELLVGRNALAYLARSIAVDDGRPDIGQKVKEHCVGLSHIGEELQAAVMAMRMTPVQHVFARFPRLVRDLSRRLGKAMRLEVSGGETELDKTVIEALGDPLVHLIRNAADHGLEPTEARIAAGKPAEGVIRLHAAQRGQSVLVQITDDGRGLNSAAIRKKALANGLYDQTQLERMSEDELANLIFAPGLSTAGSVSEVSGRGVGMDVVRRGIERIGGSVQVASRPGLGCTITMRLPLTLTVSRGLEVAVAGERFYLPLDVIVETVKVDRERFHRHRRETMVAIRGDILVVHDLAALLDLPAAERGALPAQVPLVIIRAGDRREAVRVDEFFREGEFVLKPLPKALGRMPWIMGSTITPTGQVILILDAAKLLTSPSTPPGAPA